MTTEDDQEVTVSNQVDDAFAYPFAEWLEMAVTVATALLQSKIVRAVQLAEVQDPFGDDKPPYLILAIVGDDTAEEFLQRCENPRKVPDIDIADTDSDTSVAFDIERLETVQEIGAKMLGFSSYEEDGWRVSTEPSLTVSNDTRIFLVRQGWTNEASRLNKALTFPDWEFSTVTFEYAAAHRFIFNPSQNDFTPIP